MHFDNRKEIRTMGKHYDVASDIKRLLLSDLREQKQRQIERRILDFVFAGPKEGLCSRLLTVITTIPAMSAKNHYAPQAAIINERAASFGIALSERLTKEEAFAVVLQLEGRFGQLLSKNTPPAHVEKRTIRWLLQHFYRHIGETLDRSMQFALFLLEIFAQATQERINGIRVGQWDWNHLDYIAFLTVTHDLTLKPGRPERQWLDQLIAHIENDETVWQTWNALIRIALDRKEDEGCNFRAYIVEDDDRVDDTDRGRWMEERAVCISRTQRAILDRVTVRIKAKHERINTDCRERLDWLSAHESTMVRLHAERLRAIHEHARRGLRPSGLDHVQIDVTLLQEIGCRAVSFYPEGHILPDTALHVLMKAETPHLLLYNTVARDGTCMDWTFLKGNRLVEATPLLQKLFEYVLVDILYRLTVSNKALRPINGNGKKYGSNGSVGARTPIHVFVAPHIRNLPEGQHAGDDAKTLAAKVGLCLKEGQTCVSDYDYHVIPASYHGGRLVHQLPTEPMAIYGDSDLLEALS